MHLAELFDLSYLSELSAFFAALFLLRKRSGEWRLFKSYLLLIVVIETIGWYTGVVLATDRYTWIYNIYLLAMGWLYLWILSRAPVMRRHRRDFSILLYIFTLCALANLLFYQRWSIFDSYTEVLANVMQATVCCWLLFKLLKDDAPHRLTADPYFWLANGLLFFSLGNITVYLFYSFLGAFYKQTHIPLGYYIVNTTNVVLYGSLIAAFVCRKQTTK
jgi:hypothetical protein